MIDPKFQSLVAIKLSTAEKKKLKAGVEVYGTAWTHSNFDWLKIRLNRDLRAMQYNRCCYCRRIMKFDKGLVEIEHIIYKGKAGKYARFTFVMNNLALACKDCNNGKGTKEVLRKSLPAKASYPTDGAIFLWVHPYFHSYSDHILIHNAWVYEANNGSPEGCAVIEKCKLATLHGKERANRELLVGFANSFDDAVQRAVGMVSEVGLDALCLELSPLLSKMIGAGDNTVNAELAIRNAHAAVNTAAQQARA